MPRVVAASALLFAGPAIVAQTSDSEGTDRLHRLVHRFDFNEPENFEPLPMYWRQWNGPEFPLFGVGSFDRQFGHEAPPSFRLDARGRNVAFRYTGQLTPVLPNSEYVVIGWIRPDRLTSARASLSAYYLDREGLPIAASQVFSPLIGSGETDSAWQRVEIRLPSAPYAVGSLALTAWVVQPAVWDVSPRPHRHIEHQDIESGAWFDDILVFRLPGMSLTTPAPANVFIAPEVAEIQATVADSDGEGLTAEVVVRDAAGQVVQASPVPVQTGPQHGPTTFALPGLEPGLYQATLSIFADGQPVDSRSLRFAWLAEPVNPRAGTAKSFGVVLDPVRVADTRAEQRLLSALDVGAVKVPVWPALSERGARDELLNDLLQSRVALTGVFGAPPDVLVQSAGEYARPLLAILGDDPAGWSPHLQDVVAPYASIFHSWQVGLDGDRDVIDNPDLPQVLDKVRAEMTRMITNIEMVVPGDAVSDVAGTKLAAEEMTAAIGPQIPADWISQYLQRQRKWGYDRFSAFMETERQDGFARLPWLAQFARRVVSTRHAGVDTTFLPQLWHSYSSSGDGTEPTEAYIVYRTIIDVLRDSAPGPQLRLDPQVQTVSFLDLDAAILVMWDAAAPMGGRPYRFQLGGANRWVDPWGRSGELVADADGLVTIQLFPNPVFIVGMERWLVEFASAVRISPPRVEQSLAPREHVIHFDLPAGDALAGQVTLQSPPGWQVSPQRFTFRMPADAGRGQPVEIRYPPNEPAGQKEITARVEFETEPPYVLEVPLRFELGLENIDVAGFAFREGEDVVVRQVVTNRSDRPVSFRSFAIAPGRSRQFRVVHNLKPALTATQEFRFKNGGSLSERTIRLGLHEIDGPRRHIIELESP